MRAPSFLPLPVGFAYPERKPGGSGCIPRRPRQAKPSACSPAGAVGRDLRFGSERPGATVCTVVPAVLGLTTRIFFLLEKNSIKEISLKIHLYGSFYLACKSFQHFKCGLPDALVSYFLYSSARNSIITSYFKHFFSSMI